MKTDAKNNIFDQCQAGRYTPPPLSGSFQGISLRGGSATDGMPLTILEYRSASRMFSFDLFLFM